MEDILFKYPVKLKKQHEGGYLVRFPDFPEAITQGDNIDDALEEASDCLEEAIANRIVMGTEIPFATLKRKAKYEISLHATIAAKVALYMAMKNQNINKVSLAKQLDYDEKEIRRFFK